LAQSPENVTLDEIVVESKASESWVEPEREAPRTEYEAGREQMRWFDTPGGANSLTAIGESPGVKISTMDAYGLNNLQGGQKGIRVRGEVSTHGITGTAEGLALGGPGPGPGYLFLFDKENIASVRLAQGALPADTGGLFGGSGALDTRLLFPREQARHEVSMAFGGENFRRYFARIDSGRFASGTALFLSASKTTANKWRGHGEAPEGRNNVEFGLAQDFGALKMKMIYAYNELAQHHYKALNYEQVSRLGHHRDDDYSTDPTTNDYYGYNRQDFTNQALITEFTYDIDANTRVSLKPFWARERGYYLFGGGQPNMVMKWLIDHDTYGATAEVTTKLADTHVKVGYSWTSAEPPGPPTVRKAYRITTNGLQFQQWNTLNETADRHEYSALYMTGQKKIERFTIEGGLRYARERLPGIDAYNTTGLGDMSVEDAYDAATKNPNLSVRSRTSGYLLPRIGFSYVFTPAVSAYINVGRNIGSPALGIFNQAPAPGRTSQYYWDEIRPELTDNVDIGAHFRFGDFSVDPVVYVGRTKNKGVNVYSDDTRTVWSQNVGKTRQHGALLAVAWEPSSTWRVFGNFSYTMSTFQEDVRGAGGVPLDVEGRQLPDVPRFMGNLGLIWRRHGVTVTPIVRHVGKRWSTVNYSESVPAYTTLDIGVGYELKTSHGTWEAGLSLINVFDRHYVDHISASEVNTTANGSIYYPGAPRTLVGKLSLMF
jgi:iron complex outermembrane receptor protein